MKYDLGFISDENIFNHIKGTVNNYRLNIDFKEFNKNFVDPIKFTFDSKVYRKTIKETIENEIIRQIDKTNSNSIGYFHQNLFSYIGKDWVVPKQGFDIVNEKEKIYVEMKNKHNTMNSSSSQKTYMRMLHKINQNTDTICMLVEVIAKKSQNVKWETTLDGNKVSDNRIRRVSVDKFYEIVTGDKFAFKKLCEILPIIIDDVLSNIKRDSIDNGVFSALEGMSDNISKSLYLTSFKTYEGFSDLDIKM
ncbi:MAG: Eco47II family restriction endonuclease [Candidatus Gracilibacteria bacterium]|nr:Eco47II family restriction endonuclease [Candidatus Gracilibacteria bacterium]